MPEDKISLQRLNLLHPSIRQGAILAYEEAVKKTPVGVHPFITDTLRTFKTSDDLYAQGRTKPGPIVTNAKAGQSYHNYGLAIDFVLEVKGKYVWIVNKDWMTVVEAFKKKGFTWGGDWGTFKDFPHFEKTLGYSWKSLLKKHDEGKTDSQGYVLL